MKSRDTLRVFIVMATTVFFLHASFAIGGGIYRWKDENGKLHFGDRPPMRAKSRRVEMKSTTVSVPENVRERTRRFVSSLAADREEPAQHRKRNKVVMYSAAWCGVCKRARRYFSERHIPFKEYDIDTSAEGRKRYARYGVKSIPVIATGKRHMVGFSPQRFESFYAAGGKR